MNKSAVIRALRYPFVLLPAIVMVVGALLIETKQHEVLRHHHVAESALLAAAGMDVRIGKLLEVTRYCAESPDLIEELDLARVAQTCGRYAALLGAWVVLVETGEIHKQLLNTRSDAPAVLPVVRRVDEYPALLDLEMTSRKSGKPGIAQIFTGRVYPKGVLSTGQYLKLADGRDAMLYVGMSVRDLSEQLAKFSTEGGLIFALMDASHRVVARSAGIGQFVPLDASPWIKHLKDEAGSGSALNVAGLTGIGGIWDAGYHPLSMAPGWMAVALRSVDSGTHGWSLFSLRSGLSMLGFVLSYLLFWLLQQRDRVARTVIEADRIRDEALRQNREKSRLLASFAHDVRTPLISLIGSLEMTGARALAFDAGRSARSSAEALLQLVDDILELSFLGSGEFTLNPSPVDLRRLAHETLDQFREEAARKQIELRAELDQGLPAAVEVDRLRLQQVLSNLLSNAVKYTKSGSVTLYIASKSASEGEVDLGVSVTDTGIGIDAEDVPRILREFGRLEQPYSQEQTGAGLGLAIVQRILKAMHSSLDLVSASGQGSTFSFRLMVPVAGGHTDYSEAQSLDGTLVLYAEDEPIIRQVTARRLRAAGAKVVEAADGIEALQKITHLSPDLLLIDLQMPGVDGVSVIRRIRTADRKKAYPIFVLTSHIAGPQTAEARIAGADVVLTKPLQIAPLAAALRALRGDGGKHTPAIGARLVDENCLLVAPDIFLSAADAAGNGVAPNFTSRFDGRVRNDIEELRAAIARGDLSSASKIAHRSVGLCQTLGAQMLAKKFMSVEKSSQVMDTASLAGVLEGLTDLLEATLAEFQKILVDYQGKALGKADA